MEFLNILFPSLASIDEAIASVLSKGILPGKGRRGKGIYCVPNAIFSYRAPGERMAHDRWVGDAWRFVLLERRYEIRDITMLDVAFRSTAATLPALICISPWSMGCKASQLSAALLEEIKILGEEIGEIRIERDANQPALLKIEVSTLEALGHVVDIIMTQPWVPRGDDFEIVFRGTVGPEDITRIRPWIEEEEDGVWLLPGALDKMRRWDGARVSHPLIGWIPVEEARKRWPSDP